MIRLTILGMKKMLMIVWMWLEAGTTVTDRACDARSRIWMNGSFFFSFEMEPLGELLNQITILLDEMCQSCSQYTKALRVCVLNFIAWMAPWCPARIKGPRLWSLEHAIKHAHHTLKSVSSKHNHHFLSHSSVGYHVCRSGRSRWR